jgi:YfiH family protein
VTADYLTHPSLTARHGFFTRRGGVSQGPYASLNANLSGGDDPAHVAENRARVAGSLGVATTHLLGLKQVHGTDVITVDTPWPTGQGPAADALVTRRPGIALGVITADCAPVLFHDAAAGVIGAAHAGWRGAAAGILEATVAAMHDLGATHITAVVGPCIGPRSYEVGPDLYDAVLPTLAGAETFFSPGRPPDRRYFDLAAYCLARLRDSYFGRPCGGNIQAAHSLGVDTLADHDRFFSHRRRTLGGGGPIGHQISAITL